MTREEAIKALERAEGYIGIHYVNGVEDPYINPCLLKAIDFAVAALREQEKHRWIPVTERLPKEWVDALVLSRYGFCEVAVYLGNPGKWRITWNHDLFEVDSITHWMPLPDPPKEDAP